MKRTNWIILQSKDRGTNYGVGTFIRHFTCGMAQHKELSVFVLQSGLTEISEFQIEKKGNITYLKVPLIKGGNTIGSQKHHEKVAKSIIRVVAPCIPKADRTIAHMNFLHEYFLCKELAVALQSKVIFTQHITPLGPTSITGDFNLEKEVFSLSDSIIPVTNNGKDSLIQRSAHLDKLVTIYNGISPSLFDIPSTDNNIKDKYGLKKDTLLILYAGRLDSGKGLQYLLNAFSQVIKEFPDSHLVLAGDGNFHEIILHSCNISSYISFLGQVPFSDLLALYQKAAIGVIPSQKEECSYVALEMLHGGLPVIASKVGGLREIFTHNEDALLVNMVPSPDDKLFPVAPDVTQMVEYILLLLSNKNLREQFSIRAKQKAIRKFSDQVMINKYIELINTHLQ